jgi:penicillin-binding protein 1A
VRQRIDPWFQRRWVRLLAIAGSVLLALFAAIWLYFATGLPSAEKLLAYQPALPSNVRSYDGDPVQSFARERRVNLAYDEYPPLIVQAFISAEDKAFFKHGGIDYPSLLGAVGDFTVKSVTGGGRARGGSTITQQVAKSLLQDSSYNVGRKAREAILAFRLESTLSKEEILELYLNQIFLGRNAYGVQAASRAYFDKDVGRSLAERGGLSRGAYPRRRPIMTRFGPPSAHSAGAITCSGR